jgi:hypothetical protein
MATSTDLRAAIEEVQGQLQADQGDESLVSLPAEGGWTARLQIRSGALPWWAISSVVHAVIFLLATLLTVAVPPAQVDEVIISTDVATRAENKYDEKLQRDIFKQRNEIQHETEVERPVLVHEEAEISDHFETENDMNTNTARGQEDAISDIPLGGTGVSGSMGVGGGGMAGCFGYRGGGGRKRAVARFGGSKATESAVEAALRWLARHQESEGYWDMSKWGGGSKRGSLAMTGLATLAFLGAGYTHRTGKFRDNVHRAINWLVSQQHDNGGLLGKDIEFRNKHWDGYCHAMASMALVEAYGMTRDPDFKEAAQKTVDYTVDVHQVPYGGWRYEPRQAGDISHTGWFIMQLKSAKVAGLQVDGAAFQGGMKFVGSVLSPASGRSTYVAGGASAHFKQVKSAPGRPDRRTAINMVCRLFMGVPRDDELLKLSARYPAAFPPKWGEEDFYYWYYGTLACFQMGGDTWKTWNTTLKPTLVDNQRKGGPLDGSERDVDGSWDYERDSYGRKCGRTYTTALGALCLEVYYRYLPMYRK